MNEKKNLKRFKYLKDNKGKYYNPFRLVGF